MWPMPLPAELRPSLDSPVADIANMGERYGGMLVAGLFLAEFVPTRGGEQGEPSDGAAEAADAPAGDEQDPVGAPRHRGPLVQHRGAHGYTPKGGTGVTVRTLLRLLEDVAANGA